MYFRTCLHVGQVYRFRRCYRSIWFICFMVLACAQGRAPTTSLQLHSAGAPRAARVATSPRIPLLGHRSATSLDKQQPHFPTQISQVSPLLSHSNPFPVPLPRPRRRFGKRKGFLLLGCAGAAPSPPSRPLGPLPPVMPPPSPPSVAPAAPLLLHVLRWSCGGRSPVLPRATTAEHPVVGTAAMQRPLSLSLVMHTSLSLALSTDTDRATYQCREASMQTNRLSCQHGETHHLAHAWPGGLRPAASA